ncbi:hypothetical protein BDV26DRAFT_288958 [Aspergillus bertholletiae]|uniref:Uncharacterized protein n=1 Tax=Aspergillus bertholletiae TaxID=1226010 RepID=A0A5N7BJN5_9EURO|nr:hypothetical protein BDV26DRAFT_288958 [Aspergillus bertholletiae]
MSSISPRALRPLYATRPTGILRSQRLLLRPFTYGEASVPLRSFSTCFSLANKQTGPDSSEPPQYPAFSFEALGISKGTKAFIIAILCCVGTMETWFWCETIWHWWKGKSDEAQATE